MADAPVVHIGENSPEHVAFQLMQKIFLSVEDRSWKDTTRKDLLDLYKECLNAVRNPDRR